jgi:predicted amidohydrolase YtcJ
MEEMKYYHRAIRLAVPAILSLLAVACDPSEDTNQKPQVTGPAESANSGQVVADSIYSGGDILTMVGDQPGYVEALAIRDGKIIAVGSQDELQQYKRDSTRQIDLEGKTLLPGFYDAHSHFFQTAIKLSTVSLDPPPAGNVTNIDDIISLLKTELNTNPRKAGEWLYGWGYDNGMLKDNRHPTKMDLDKVSTEVPICIYHFSGHMLVLNSKGLELMGFTAESVAPEGGVIQRMPGSSEPSGIIEEQAIKPVMMQMLASVQGEHMIKLMDRSQQLYKQHGYTSMLEMAGTPELVTAFRSYAAAGKLDIDLSAAVLSVTQSAEQTAKQFSLSYQDRFRVIGGKINLDGGSPGRTAFLREPYYTQDEGKPAGYRGYPSVTNQDELDAVVTSFYQAQIPLFIHALGDAAIDQAIRAVTVAQQAYPREDIRQQLIHLQVFQPDQIQALKALDVSLTFQNTHNYYFADFHASSTLGPERTGKLCPMATAIKEGFNVTFHHDSPVHPVSQIDIIWMAVNRTSRSGKMYGPEERIGVYQALQASTINAAWQFFEEDSKGSLEVGKLADLVILDNNPLKVAPEDINQIQVLETIKEGATVWSQKQKKT